MARVRIKSNFKQILKMKEREMKRVDKATVKALDRFGAIIRQDSRKLIGAPAKPRKIMKKQVIIPVAPKNGKPYMRKQTILVASAPAKPRPPGQPPKDRGTSAFMSLRNIVYRTDYRKRSVRIGTQAGMGKKYGALTVPDLHEFGATITTRIRKINPGVRTSDLKRKTTKNADGSKSVDLMQVSNSMILIESKRGTLATVKIPKRPYMRPAFKRHKSKATQIWKDFYKASRRK